MKKMDIDAISLRLFPRIGSRWVRLLVAGIVFFPYVYLVFPFRRLAENPVNSFLLICFFGVIVLADSSFMLLDIKDRPVTARSYFEGELVDFREGRGVGGSKGFVLLGNEQKLFKALSVRSSSSLNELRDLQGQRVVVWYQEAKGLFTKWSLPVHIELPDGSVIYDYSENRKWFKSPATSVDYFLVQASKIYFVLLVILFPLQFISRLVTREGERS